MEAILAIIRPKKHDTDKIWPEIDKKRYVKETPPRIPIIQPHWLKGMEVFVHPDPGEDRDQICEALRIVGATVKQAIEDSDIVISRERLPKRPEVAKVKSSNTERPRQTKNVLLAQIPWVSRVVSGGHADAGLPMVVVADVSGTHRPEYRRLRCIPELHFEAVPRGYPYSPFEPVRAEEATTVYLEKLQQPVRPGDGPTRQGFCEICQSQYSDAHLHRAASNHRRLVAADKWRDFDMLAAHLRSGPGRL